MRCLLGTRKLAKFSRFFGINFVKGLTRGGTDHRFDLYDANGNSYYFWKDEMKLYKDEVDEYDEDKDKELKKWFRYIRFNRRKE
jgi:hypothetical protein